MTLLAHPILFSEAITQILLECKLYLKESMRHSIDKDGKPLDTPGNTYLFEQQLGNEVSLNYWIQKTINTLEIPELDNWKNSVCLRHYNRNAPEHKRS